MDLPREAEIATARRLVVLVGLAYLVIQLLVFSFDRPPGWDEAVYLSQVAPGADALVRPLEGPDHAARDPGPPARRLADDPADVPGGRLGGRAHRRVPDVGVGDRDRRGAAVLFAGAWPTLFYGSS